MVNNTININSYLSLQIIEHKWTSTYTDGNLGGDFEHAEKYGEI